MAVPIITGSWIDVVHPNRRDGVYWNRKTLGYSDQEWAVLIRHLKQDLGIEILLLQNVVAEGMAVYPSKVVERRWKTSQCQDPVGAMMRACSAEGVAMYMGVGCLPTDTADMGPAEANDAAIDWYKRASEDLYERYGRERSFAGWYMTNEMYLQDGRYKPEQIASCRRLTDIWQSMTPNLPRIASPYFLSGVARFERNDEQAKLIAQSGLTVIAYQDGVGCATGRDKAIPPSNNEKLFADLRWAHEKAGVKLWANTELFCFENDVWFQPLIPASFERIHEQLRLAAPYVDRVIAYTVPGIMTSQAVCPNLGAPETERLYQAYRGYLDHYRIAQGRSK